MNDILGVFLLLVKGLQSRAGGDLCSLIVCDDHARHILWNDCEESEYLQRREVIFCGQKKHFQGNALVFVAVSDDCKA